MSHLKKFRDLRRVERELLISIYYEVSAMKEFFIYSAKFGTLGIGILASRSNLFEWSICMTNRVVTPVVTASSSGKVKVRFMIGIDVPPELRDAPLITRTISRHEVAKFRNPFVVWESVT